MSRHRNKMRKRTLLSWSSGKDSAWALHHLQQDPAIELVGLFTVVEQKYNRASMHDTRLEMLNRQAEAADLPLETVHLPEGCSNDEYDAIMRQFIARAASNHIDCIAFGDLFVGEIRKYRETQLYGSGIEPMFPLWGIPTKTLAHDMLSAGLEAHISSVDLNKLPSQLAGKKWSRELIATLPSHCDPCGENGEIHTIVVAGPMFKQKIPINIGAIVERDGFAYADIIPLN